MIEKGRADDGLLSLRTTTEAHHALLVPHIDRLLTLGEMVGHVECSALHAGFEQEYDFIVAQLLPHMDAMEQTLYGQLERLMQGRHSMAPMREEHRGMRQIIESLGRYRDHVDDCAWTAIEGLALRRLLYRLHALLKVHLAEEELYLGVLEAHLSDVEKDRLARSLDHARAEHL